MPNVTIPLPNVEESVSRPLIADLTKQFREMTGLEFVEDVRFMNYAGNVQSYDSSRDQDNERYASFTGKTRMFVEVEENYNENGWASSKVEQVEHVPLFVDPQLNVFITPVVIPSDVILKVRFQTRSRDEARRWRDDIVMRLAQLREGRQHRLTFNINLPNSVWYLINHIHDKRENIDGYGESIHEYIRQHSHKDLTIVSNAKGEFQTYAFNRVLNRVNGRFSVSPLPERPSFDEAGGVWECSMEYTITYDRPVGCVVRYPIQVHQQFLDDKYILPNDPHEDMRDKNKTLSESQKALSMFESYNIAGYHCSQDAVMQEPWFDDHVYDSMIRSTASVFRGLCQFSVGVPQNFLNLHDLGSTEIDADILQFLREVEYPYLNKPFTSFFGVQIYRDQDLLDPETYSVDEALNLFYKEPVNLRKPYRVRFCIYVDPSLLPYSAFQRLYNYPKVIQKLVQAINDALRYNVDFQDLVNLRPLKPWEFDKLWHILIGLAPPGETGLSTSGGNFCRDIDNPAKHFGIPDEAWKSLRSTPRMRTVQIAGTLAYRNS